MLPLILQELQKYFQKTCGRLIRVLNERSVSDGEHLCPLWLVILKAVRHRRHLIAIIQFAVLCALLCPETDWDISIGKESYVFILNDFKR